MNTNQITGNNTKENENLLKYIYNGLEYLLDLQRKEAIILGAKFENFDEVLIQRYILYEDQKFIVTSIADFAFEYKFIRSVIFPENSEVHTIGRFAFLTLPIVNIVIPSSVKRICRLAFFNCIKLKKIEFAANSKIQTIEKNAFCGSSLESLSIPSSVENLEVGWCTDTSKLTNVTIIQNEIQNISLFENKFIVGKTNPKSDNFDILLFARRDIKHAIIPSFIKKIGPYSFSHCFSLNKLEFESNSKIQTIEKKAFFESNLESIEIPSSTEFEESWCSDTSKLTNVTIILNEIQNISLFENKFIVGKTNPKSDNFDILLFARRDIKHATIPSFIKKICSCSFAQCKKLEKLEFEKNTELEIIEKKAFYDSSIQNITIPSSVTLIKTKAFSDCEGFRTADFEANSKLQKIETKAFRYSNIENLSIPSSITELENGWCKATKSLKNITIIQNEVQNISLFENKFIVGKTNLKSDIYDILLFALCSNIQAIIPSFIKQIDYYSFSHCNIQKLEFEKKSNLKIIQNHAFQYNTIMSIEIPSSVTIIGKSSFNNCKKLRKIDFQSDSQLQIIGKKAFGETSIEKIVIPCHVTQINEKTFFSCNKLQVVEFQPNSELKIIDKLAFAYSSLKSIAIPPSVIHIEKNAFKNSNIQIIELNEKFAKSNSLNLCFEDVNEIIMVPR